MKCVFCNALSTDRIAYHGVFRFLKSKAAFDLDFGDNPIPFILSTSNKVARDNSANIMQKVAAYVTTF